MAVHEFSMAEMDLLLKWVSALNLSNEPRPDETDLESQLRALHYKAKAVRAGDTLRVVP